MQGKPSNENYTENLNRIEKSLKLMQIYIDDAIETIAETRAIMSVKDMCNNSPFKKRGKHPLKLIR